ncbi:MAG: hypothetical protein GTN40_01665 [Candidatus Aenigmarchaeota archaeon]|nr:hypothetical protein [Candidatus Aenigmarchaeota archaeon]
MQIEKDRKNFNSGSFKILSAKHEINVEFAAVVNISIIGRTVHPSVRPEDLNLVIRIGDDERIPFSSLIREAIPLIHKGLEKYFNNKGYSISDPKLN